MLVHHGTLVRYVSNWQDHFISTTCTGNRSNSVGMDIKGSISVTRGPSSPTFHPGSLLYSTSSGSSHSHTSCGVLALPHLGSLAFPYLTLGPCSHTPHPGSPALPHLTWVPHSPTLFLKVGIGAMTKTTPMMLTLTKAIMIKMTTDTLSRERHRALLETKIYHKTSWHQKQT